MRNSGVIVRRCCNAVGHLDHGLEDVAKPQSKHSGAIYSKKTRCDIGFFEGLWTFGYSPSMGTTGFEPVTPAV